MAKAKKFGTFGGVFTPSILTILGVIMYLRFPTILGQAGLINTIGIIVVAHIISITTSLSVASLSTDKPVQTGGTYFMISRSLGLPIGGTLGLALFVGLSFSVSLYLIGFSESFLQYWGIEHSVNAIRITGTIVLTVVTTITFISASLAIKSQYFIMAAIFLSFLSILFGKHDLAPTEINFAPLATSAPFMVLFGIFFPAVTGFEAGVAMSGDLKNPKKSLPLGAIMAVGVGLVVYIIFAFFYTYTVDANALYSDPEILFKISLVPALVLMGIWGATLSSALGSILGAPRILQAIAMDKIAPKWFAKGTGKSNEPRNALILAFIIAEAGILIGELDLIARIVSMFFITTYAFLNLASAIESWSSSDFRPAFKVPRFVSVIGTIAAFFVMILLDFLALAGATIVLGFIYFYLQRKELILESGDAWSSFWTNLAKRALLKLSVQKTDKRNWRPNIILFSGGQKARPHLVEMGLALTGKLGALTDFNLSLGETGKYVPQRIKGGKKGKKTNYFIRELACETLQSGIETVTNIYGFSGFEPNSVLMGWSRDAKNADFLASVLKDLKNKNLNAVFLDYHAQVGFGKKEAIDIWWNGKGRHLSFSLNLLRFLLSDPDWRDAKVRIMVINSDTSLNDSIYRNTNAILAEKRIKAEVRVINDDFGSRTKEAIFSSESVDADLIMLGVSQRNTALTNAYVQQINKISTLPASLLILNPSSEFEEINLVAHQRSKSEIISTRKTPDMPALPQIPNKVVKVKIAQLDDDLLAIGTGFMDNTLWASINNLILINKQLQEFADQNRSTFNKELKEIVSHERQKTVLRYHQSFLRKATGIIEKSNRALINETKEILNHGISEMLSRFGNYIYESADTIHIPYFVSEKNKEKIYNYPYQKALSHYLQQQVMPTIHLQLNKMEKMSAFVLSELRNLVLGLNDAYEKLTLLPEDQQNLLNSEFSKHLTDFESIENQLNQFKENSQKAILHDIRQLVITMASDFESPTSLQQAKRKIKSEKDSTKELINEFTDNWATGMSLLNNTLYLDLLVLSRKNIFKNVIQKGNARINTLISGTFFPAINKLHEYMNADIDADAAAGFVAKSLNLKDQLDILPIYTDTYHKASELLEDFPEELSIPELITQNSEPLRFADFVPVNANLQKTAFYYIDVLFHEPFYREIERLENTVSKALMDCKEANNIWLFNLNNLKEADSDSDLKKRFDKDLNKKLAAQVNEEKTKVETAMNRMNHYSLVYLHDAFSKLFYHSILQTEQNIYAEKREQKGRKINILLSKGLNAIKNSANDFVIRVVNSSSKGLILSKKYLSESTSGKTQVKKILDLVEELLPDSKAYNAVPVFYRNLMSSTSKITEEFMVPRNEEMNTIKDALKRHKRGLGGAVIIKGVHGSGKTVLSRYAAFHLFKKNNVLWITPPEKGAVRVEDLLHELREQTGRFGDFDSLLNYMPYESVMVLNDLELWWERSPEGGAAINKILELIRLYSNKIFFILNCNHYAFNILRQLFPLEDNSLAIVDCQPFTAKQLQQLIMSRHKSSSLSLIYNGKTEESIPQLTYSMLFNTYFNISQGIPGIAINTWKANIIEAKQDTIRIKKPKKMSFDALYHLNSDWLIIIALFIQHKNMDVEKLIRITGLEKDECENYLMQLKNSGLIVKNQNNIFTVGRTIEPLLVEVCREKGII
ncbi:Amino acid transporter [Saccharicrinis carchari]|uniref:Amino acid transporter n=1 Tax=Saccharicrinis carchari TaxID=1168039 RepID=A0A521BYS7_SACCC|nr:amino acid permease [Saccharicrinis carchari]SMO52333.1 Amino acid transporter [Saccharicrinis carchari]